MKNFKFSKFYRSLLSLVIFILVTLLTSCANQNVDYLSYQNKNAIYSLSGRVNDFAFSAELVLKDFFDETKENRSYSLRLNSPQTISGVEFHSELASTYLKYGDITIPTPQNAPFSYDLIYSLFSINGNISDVELLVSGDQTFNRIILKDEESAQVFEVLLDVKTSMPKRVSTSFEGTSVVVDVESIVFLDQQNLSSN